MKILFKVLLLLMFSLSLQAESEKSFIYNGQNGESFNLETTKDETRYREEEVDDTCTRQIPYTVNECGYETRYRRVCRTIPGRNVCRTVNDRVCRNVQRTRRVCRTIPGQRHCRTQPSRRVCNDRNGRQVCTTIPSRQVCSTGTSRQQCSNQTYNDRVCSNNPRQVCNWQPSRQDCTQQPYQDYVCRDVTRYRSEDYACRRTIQIPYTITRDVVADVSFDFVDNLINEATAKVTTKLTGDQIDLLVEDLTNGETLIYLEKNNVVDSAGDDEISITSKNKLTFVPKVDFTSTIKNGISKITLKDDKAFISLSKVSNFAKVILDLTIKRSGVFGIGSEIFNKKNLISGKDFIIQNTENGSDLIVNINDLKKNKKYKVNLKLSLKAKEGNLINPISDKLELNKEEKIKSHK